MSVFLLLGKLFFALPFLPTVSNSAAALVVCALEQCW